MEFLNNGPASPHRDLRGCCRPPVLFRRGAGARHLPRRGQRRDRRAREKLARAPVRSEEHTSELQSLMRISYAVFCLKKKKRTKQPTYTSLKKVTIIPKSKTKCTT